MSYTILTIPFNLKEKEKGPFLEKGFVFDEVFSHYFKSQNQGNPFLHYFTFNPKAINEIAISLFIELNFPNSNLSKKIDEQNPSLCLYHEPGFFDKKHLKSTKSFIQGLDGEEINNKQLQIADYVTDTKFPKEIISKNFKFLYKKAEHSVNISFTIDAVKLYINKSELTKRSIGFGFLQIVLKWDFENAKSMIYGLEPLSELFRYYKGGDDKKNKFEIKWNEAFNIEVQNIENKIKEGKVPAEYLEVNHRKMEEYKKWIIPNAPQKISFKLLLDRLLEEVSLNISGLFNFENEEIIKPYVLHLSSYIKKNETGNLDFERDDLLNKVYRMIRISGSENIKIRSSSNLKFAFPDPYTVQFVLNEGAFVIEGVEQSADLINKYYPSFLFALNQKYLFNYMQEKINELPLIKKDHLIKYNAKDLKVLQQTMINAEFCQIFTSLSNYNEIDMFFENLREKFKINELKLEYMASIEGISRITQIKEKEEDDQHRKIEEQKTDENNKRLNNILLILTIAQVWSGLVGIFEYKDEDRWKLYLNLVVYLIFLVLIVSNIKNKSIKK
jgi:hypothetical protein